MRTATPLDDLLEDERARGVGHLRRDLDARGSWAPGASRRASGVARASRAAVSP